MAAEGARGWAGRTFLSFESAPFRVLSLGSLLSMVAFFISTTVQGVVAYDITGSNRAVGLVLFAQLGAQLVFSPLGGAFGDRFPKRTVIMLGQAVVLLIFLVLAILIVTDALTLPLFVIGSGAVGGTFALMVPARQAFIGDLINPERRGNAAVITSMVMNLSRIVGPLLAGGLLAVGVIGSAGAYFTMAVLYGFALVATFFLPQIAGGRSGRGVFVDVLHGLRYVAGEPKLRSIILHLLFVNMLGFSYVTVLPAFIEDTLGASRAAIGLLYGATALGGLVVSLALSSRADSPQLPLLLLICNLVFALTLLLLGISPNLAVATAVSFLIGAGSGGFQTLTMAATLRNSAPAFYGRVSSINMMAFATFGIASLPVGFIADAFGERAVLIGMAVALFLVAAAFAPSGVRSARRGGAVTEPLSPARALGMSPAAAKDR